MTTAVLDQVCADAIDLARAAVVDEAPAGQVGDWLEALPDGDRVVTHYFSSLSKAYVDWRWAVTVARGPRSRTPTVDEIVLLPGNGSLLAPPWVPYDQRVAPGDLGVGDLHPTAPDDVRLVPGYSGEDALEPADEFDGSAPLRPEQWELGLGRIRVLSALGRTEAADRWNDGEYGPESAMAKAAPGHCTSCGFLIPVGGALGQQFGLCANEMSPADGRVVDLSYGCGAHSETPIIDGTSVMVSDGIPDDLVYDALTPGHEPPAEPHVFVIESPEQAESELTELEPTGSEGELAPEQAAADEIRVQPDEAPTAVR
jgi:hypothetical protein